MTLPPFSTAWKASKNPGKQRKYRYMAPLHLRRSLLCAHLSKALRQHHKRRSIPVRAGDTVKILRGSFSGKTGTVERTDPQRIAVYITGIERIKKDGSKHLVPTHPSNLLIQELDLKDRRRLASPAPRSHPSPPPQGSPKPTSAPKQPSPPS